MQQSNLDKGFFHAVRLALGLFTSHVATCSYSFAKSQSLDDMKKRNLTKTTNTPPNGVRVNLQVHRPPRVSILFNHVHVGRCFILICW